MGVRLLRTGRPGLQILRGVLLVMSTVFFYFALRYLPLAEAAAISFVGPVLTALLSGPMLGDKVTPRQWVAVILGFVGVLIIMRPGGGVLSLPAVFPLATAILFSIYQIVTRKLSGREHPYTTLFYTAIVGAAVTSFAAPLNWVPPTPLQTFLMVCIGLLGGFGHLLLIRAMEHASPSTLAPFVYSQLVWSTLLAYLAFGDFPEKVTLIGMLVVVAAGLLAVNWSQMRRLSDASDQAGTH
jgi:drug/metabolite transporter (DMT)-like permease